MNELRFDIGWTEYLDIEAVNPSRLVHGLKSMLAFKHAMNDAEEKFPPRNMLAGLVTHCLVFEPDQFDERFAPYFGSQRRGKEWDLWQWKNPGKEAVKPDVYEQAQRIGEAVRRSPEAREVIDATKHEVTVLCEDVGRQCKGRIDGLGNGVLLDLKTTTNVDAHAFGGIFGRLHYAEKMSCYHRWAEIVDEAIDDVYVIAAEFNEPYDVTRIPIRREVLENAWPRMERVLQRVNACEEAGHWPGVGGETELVVPTWSMPEDDGLDWGD